MSLSSGGGRPQGEGKRKSSFLRKGKRRRPPPRPRTPLKVGNKMQKKKGGEGELRISKEKQKRPTRHRAAREIRKNRAKEGEGGVVSFRKRKKTVTSGVLSEKKWEDRQGKGESLDIAFLAVWKKGKGKKKSSFSDAARC